MRGKPASRISGSKPAERRRNMSRIITISREFGSGGRAIGQAVADKLGIPCYDQELIEKIAEEELGMHKAKSEDIVRVEIK